MTPPAFFDLRDGALLVEFPQAAEDEANRRAVALGARLRGVKVSARRNAATHSARRNAATVDDAVPAARSLLVTYDPERVDRENLGATIERLDAKIGEVPPDGPGRLLRLPVLYDGEDLPELAAHTGLAPSEIVRRHAEARYRVAFVGFSPGFAYLSGLPAELSAPRRATPRARVAAGSVAIGGGWTGIYPAESPGGWRIVGRTSAVLFEPGADPPALLAPGDRVELELVDRLVPPHPAPRAAIEPAGPPVLRVLSPGLFTSVQGAPRPGLGSSGVPPGGAMDPLALGLANAEVGNAADVAALEITLSGPELEVLSDVVISGRGVVRRGERLRFGPVRRGARAYVAVAGGFAFSRRGEPTRRLSAGDLLYVAEEPVPGARRPGPAGPPAPPPDVAGEIRLRAVLGPEADRFGPAETERFFAAAWRVTPESDRRGLRLEGEPLELIGAAEIAPTGTVPGTVQVPGDGRPIVLGPDGPVTGGYPRLATVVGADLWRLGQARPGALLRFEAVSFREAASLRHV